VSTAQTSDDEFERLRVVRQLQAVGGPTDPTMERLTRLAAVALGVPVVIVELLDSDRTLCVATVGTSVRELELDRSPCAALVRSGGEQLVVEAAEASVAQGAQRPGLIDAALSIRSFATRLLRIDGRIVGAVTVAAPDPRDFDTDDRIALCDLAGVVEAHFETTVAAWSGERQLAATTGPNHGLNPALDPHLDVVAPGEPVREPVAAAESVVASAVEASALEALVRRQAVMTQHSADVVIVIAPDGKVASQSPSLGRMLGHPEPFTAPGGALSIVHAQDREFARAQIRDVVDRNAIGDPFVVRVLAGNGTIRRMECVAASYANDPAVGGTVLTMHDITDRYQLSQLVSFQATHDALTELPNRHLLAERVTPAIARFRRTGSQIAVISFEIVGFQQLADQLGRDAGDQLLRCCAKVLHRSIRAGDCASRLGGAEFAVLLDPVAHSDVVVEVADRIAAAMCGPHSLSTGISTCEVTVGIATGQPDDDAERIISRAARGRSRRSTAKPLVEIADEPASGSDGL